MAIYVPRARRRRKMILVGVAGAVLGLAAGSLIGRTSAPTVGERVRSVQSDARRVASQLRVVSLHEEEGTTSLAAPGDAGADLALGRTQSDLRTLLRRAPWIPSGAATGLLADTATLRRDAPAGTRTAEFGARVDRLAERIEATFGAVPSR